MNLLEQLVFNVKETSKVLKIGITNTYKLIHDNSIKSIKIGNKFVIPRKAIDEWIDKQINNSRRKLNGR